MTCAVTGALFGAASVWLAFPYLEEAFRDVLRTETESDVGSGGWRQRRKSST
ncbi:MAG: hypothetical protein R2856_21420 [Caldilineaceae bacterium]